MDQPMGSQGASSALVDVGGYRLAFQILGAGTPTIVFECGGDCDSEAFAGLAQRVQPLSAALLYDRAGLGRSDAAPRPRTLQDAAGDLHMLLQRAQVPGPYLLVAHSFGGLIARLYAQRYPQELAGLVLLDVPHPQQSLRELACLPAPAPDEPAALTAYRSEQAEAWSDPFSSTEAFDRTASAAQLQGAGDLGALPLAVITAGIDSWEEGFPPEIARALETDWMRSQQELAGLSSRARHIIATESTHDIHECQPELVLEVIRDMLAQHRSQSAA